jgi:sterol 24-C-methyltransferase
MVDACACPALTRLGLPPLPSHRSPHQVPWYDTLTGKMTLSGFRMTRPGRALTHAVVSVLELLRIAPRGTSKISAILNATAVDLVEGGKLEIFTPSFFFLARKPFPAK